MKASTRHTIWFLIPLFLALLILLMPKTSRSEESYILRVTNLPVGSETSVAAVWEDPTPIYLYIKNSGAVIRIDYRHEPVRKELVTVIPAKEIRELQVALRIAARGQFVNPNPGYETCQAMPISEFRVTGFSGDAFEIFMDPFPCGYFMLNNTAQGERLAEYGIAMWMKYISRN